MEWLARNSAVVQAVSALITAVATVVLSLITWRYVVITRRLSETAVRQLDFQKEAARRARDALRTELLAIVKYLRALLGHLTTDRSAGESLRLVAMWEDNDLGTLQRTASQFDVISGQHAAVALTSLRWIRDRVSEVKATDVRIGVYWDRFPWERWQKELSVAGERLETIWGAALEAPDSAEYAAPKSSVTPPPAHD